MTLPCIQPCPDGHQRAAHLFWAALSLLDSTSPLHQARSISTCHDAFAWLGRRMRLRTPPQQVEREKEKTTTKQLPFAFDAFTL